MKSRVEKLWAIRIVRFVAASLLNACVSFAVLNFAIYDFHKSQLTASLIATTCTMASSFVLNRSFVFGDKEHPGRTLARFIIVTVSGLLLIQNSVFALSLMLLRGHEGLLLGLTALHVNRNLLDVNVSNGLASLYTLFWNYNGYRLVVFTSKRRQKIAAAFGDEFAQ